MNRSPQDHPVDADAGWRTMSVAVDASAIIEFTCLFEAAENLAVVRTMDPARGVMAVMYYAGSEGDVEALVADFARRRRALVLARGSGMTGWAGHGGPR